MELDYFTSLDGATQIEIATEQGIVVGKRSVGNRSMKLYRVYNFYVEIVYYTQSRDIIKVGGFDHDILLVPYLDQIDLSSLLNIE